MIIPSLDLINGHIVRLCQGNYAQQLNYGTNPLLKLKEYEIQGAQFLHLVDLSGAHNPSSHQTALLKKILSSINVPIQIGGGIRTKENVEELLNAGATRVVVGSNAIKEPEELKRWFKKYGTDTIVLAIDVCINHQNCKYVAINGWKEVSNITFEELIEKYLLSCGLKHVLCTDISCDGMLNGPNFQLYREISNRYSEIFFQASGGICSLDDITTLRDCGINGGIIIGRAFLDNKFTVKEAISCWQKG